MPHMEPLFPGRFLKPTLKPKKRYGNGRKLIHIGLLMESLMAGNKIKVGPKVVSAEDLKLITLQDIVDNFGVFEAEVYYK